MAKIVFSGVGVTEARGKLGGNVFTKNAGGAFLRNRVVPANPNTVKQIAVRAQLATFSSAWRALTDAQRSAWAGAVTQFPYSDSLGQTKTYTGQQLFVKLNQQLKMVDSAAAQMSNPPAPVAATSFGATSTSFILTASVLTTATIGFSAATIPAGFKAQVFATRGISPGIMRPSEGEFRLVKSNPTIAASSTSILTEYLALYGSPIIGTKVYISVLLIATASGQSYEGGRRSTIVV